MYSLVRGEREERRRRTPEFDTTVVSARDDEPIVELQTSDRVVVGAEPMLSLKCCEVVYDHSTIGTARDEHVRDGVELELTDEGRVALE